MEYRIQSTGEVKTQGEVRRMHSNTSLPKVWDANVCTALGIDPVLAAPKPDTTGYAQAVRDGATQDAKGNWVQAWSVVDMFADTTEDGVTTTKAEHEAAYQANLDAKAAESVRTQRDAELAKSDWMVIRSAETGVALPTEWATYRQALRDITGQTGFPNEINWPVEP
tara:strand:- start:3548 stop:4048 length:501 start_codon:yes stop_codon:yes gene_type:complete